MNNNRRQAQFLLRSITDDVPQLLLEENNLVFRNEDRLQCFIDGFIPADGVSAGDSHYAL